MKHKRQKIITREGRYEQSALLISDTYRSVCALWRQTALDQNQTHKQTSLKERVGVYSWESKVCCKAAMCNVRQTLGTNAHTCTNTHVQTHLVAVIKCAPTHIGTNQRGITANLSLQAYLHHVSISNTHTHSLRFPGWWNQASFVTISPEN